MINQVPVFIAFILLITKQPFDKLTLLISLLNDQYLYSISTF